MENHEHKTVHKSEREAFSIVKRAKSFTHATRGIALFIKTTHNAWVQIIISAIAIFLGFHFNISADEWMFLIFAIGFVLVSECFNTAIEFDINLTSPDFHPYAKYTKDVAAGAVLLSSFVSIIIGLIIFLPKIFLFS